MPNENETMIRMREKWIFITETKNTLNKDFILQQRDGGISLLIKDTWYLWGKNSKNMQLLDVL